MAIKSTINVDVEAKSLIASASALDKFAKACEKSNTLWDKYGTSVSAAQKSVNELTRAFHNNNSALNQTLATHSTLATTAGSVGKAFSSLANSTKNVATNLARISVSLIPVMSLFGIVGGLLGAGAGLFGADALANVVSARRKAAMRMGAGYGASAAFDLNFSRYGDASAWLSATSEGLYDVTSPSYLAMLNAGAARGIQGGSPTDSVIDILQSLPKTFANTPENTIGPRAQSLGLTAVLSVKEIVAYLHASPEERLKQLNNFRADSETLNISVEAQQKWADFSTSLKRAGVQIETILGDKLVVLADPIANLSASVSKVITALSNSPVISDALNSLETGMEWFIGQFHSEQFKKYSNDFLTAINALGPVIKHALEASAVIAKFGWSLADPNSGAKQYSTWSRYLDWMAGVKEESSPLTPSTYGGHYPWSIRRGNWNGPRGGSDVNPTTGKKWWNEPTGSVAPGPSSVSTTGLPAVEADNMTRLTTRLQRIYPQLTGPQCVELAFRMSGIPYTNANVRSITRGPNANDPNIPAGTPVSTFFNADRTVGDHYAAGGTGTPGIGRDHMGVKAPDDGSGKLTLLDQWAGKSPSLTPYSPNDRPGTEHDANAYYAIMDPMGLPAGTYENNPYRRQVLSKIAADRFSGGAAGMDAYQQRQRAIERRTRLEGRGAFLDTLQHAKSPKSVVVVDNSFGSSHITHDRTAYG